MIHEDETTRMIQTELPREGTEEEQPGADFSNDPELAEIRADLDQNIGHIKSRTATYCVPDSDFEQPINSLGILSENVQAAACELENQASGAFVDNSEFCAVTDAGYYSSSSERKTVNDDAYLVIPRYQTAFVWDGVSGKQKDMGRVAAAIGVHIAACEMYDEAELKDVFHKMHRGVLRYQDHNPHNPKTGACVVGARLMNGKVEFAHAGDSRGLVLRGISTIDDNDLTAFCVVSDIKDENEVNPFWRATLKRYISQALGHRENLHNFNSTERHLDINPHPEEFPVESGDIVLLCSDGLTSVMSNDEIADFIYYHMTFANCTLEEAIIELKEYVLEQMHENRGIGDNLTIVAFIVP